MLCSYPSVPEKATVQESFFQEEEEDNEIMLSSGSGDEGASEDEMTSVSDRLYSCMYLYCSTRLWMLSFLWLLSHCFLNCHLISRQRYIICHQIVYCCFLKSQVSCIQQAILQTLTMYHIRDHQGVTHEINKPQFS